MAGERKHKTLFWHVFKILFFTFCLSGTVYHVNIFLKFYLTYPEVVDITVDYPDVLKPAFTVCDPNPILKQKLCEDHPQSCETITKDDRYCVEHPRYCKGKGNWTYVMSSFFEPPSDTIEFMNNYRRTLEFVRWAKGSDRNHLKWEESLYADRYHMTFLKCYTFKPEIHLDRIQKGTGKNILTLNLEVKKLSDEPMYRFSKPPGAIFRIHEPLDIENPLTAGSIKLTTGKFYEIQFRVEEERRLPSPYKSHCIHYTSKLETNETAQQQPRSQENCFEICKKKKFCTLPMGKVFEDWQFPLSYCERDDVITNFPGLDSRFERWKIIEDAYETCMSECKPACRKETYLHTHQELDLNFASYDGRYYPFFSATVRVYLQTPEVVVLEHKPKYQAEELFSTIGGFLGIWLGISLFALPGLGAKFFRRFCRSMCSKNFRTFARKKSTAGGNENGTETATSNTSQHKRSTVGGNENGTETATSNTSQRETTNVENANGTKTATSNNSQIVIEVL